MASDKTEWLSIKQNGYLNTMAINRKYWLSIEQIIDSFCRSAGFIDSAASYATLFWAQYLHCKGVYLFHFVWSLELEILHSSNMSILTKSRLSKEQEQQWEWLQHEGRLPRTRHRERFPLWEWLLLQLLVHLRREIMIKDRQLMSWVARPWQFLTKRGAQLKLTLMVREWYRTAI